MKNHILIILALSVFSLSSCDKTDESSNSGKLKLVHLSKGYYYNPPPAPDYLYIYKAEDPDFLIDQIYTRDGKDTGTRLLIGNYIITHGTEEGDTLQIRILPDRTTTVKYTRTTLIQK